MRKHLKYEDIRAECVVHETYFEDPEFSPSSLIYGFDESDRTVPKYNDIVWKRPIDIVDYPKIVPKFEVDGFSRLDIVQGNLGDCFFLAALGSLTENEKLFRKVVPEDNSFEVNYGGVFHFQ